MRELFRQVSNPHPMVGSRRLSALPVSVAVHVAVLLAVVVIPLLATDVLPLVQRGVIEFQIVNLPSVPPPSPMPRPRVAAPAPAVEANAAPVVAPTGIAPSTGLAPTATPDVDAPERRGVVDADLPSGLNGVVVTDTPPAIKPVAPVRAQTLLRPPVRLRDAAPTYPEMARIARVEGTVIIEAVINAGGEVIEAKVLRSVPLLDQAAIDAVRQWKYTPSLLNGIPVPVVMTVTVTFTLK
jgi:periplasmic protein TonB